MTNWTDLKTRTISAVILGAAVLFITWWDFISFCALLLLAGFILLREWRGLTRHRHWMFIPFGFLYIGAGMVGLAVIHYEGGWAAIYILLGLVWSADIGGYFVGKKFGKHKIAPAISPGKSWEGLTGSILFTFFFAFTFAYPIEYGRSAFAIATDDVIPSVILALLVSCLGLAGDLFESSLKRHAGVKDSGSLIPGHGGLFDRLDALIPCAILFGGMTLALLLACSLYGECL